MPHHERQRQRLGRQLGCELINGKHPCKRCLKSGVDCVTVPRKQRHR